MDTIDIVISIDVVISVVLYLDLRCARQMWNRKCSELAFQWGTINMTSLDDTPRPTFHGKMGEDTVTGKMQPQYPAWKTYTKVSDP